MFTPQQIEQISFSKSTFGGYNMEQVDEILEPLTEDYVALYKENALLKSKMRVLVGKLEEYRKNEASLKEAVQNAKRTCDRMIQEAEAKCAQMTRGAAAPAPVAAAGNSDALVDAENARVEEARKTANSKINEIQEQMRSCIQALDRIKAANPVAEAPAPAEEAPKQEAPAVDPSMVYDSGAVADEIAQKLESLVGTTEEPAPKAAPKHPVSETTTSRFANLNLQFGRNYDPTQR